MHTFGGPLNFHPHVHILLTLGGLTDDSNFDFYTWKDNTFFPEKVLKARFKYHLIKSLRDFAKQKLLQIPNSIKQIWWKKYNFNDFYNVTTELYKVIWYVYIGEKLDNAAYTTRYIGRYAKRPCLSEAKIDYYSKEKQIVKFTYKDKISKTFVQETVSVEEFITRLIRHIPEKNFRMIRYYGLFANAVKNKLIPILIPQIAALFGIANLKFEPNPKAKNWRELIIESTGTDPLICTKCNEQMELTEIGYRARDGTFKTVNIFN